MWSYTIENEINLRQTRPLMSINTAFYTKFIRTAVFGDIKTCNVGFYCKRMKVGNLLMC